MCLCICWLTVTTPNYSFLIFVQLNINFMSIQIPQRSERFGESVPSHVEDEQSILPEPQKSKKPYIGLFLLVVFLIVWSIHYNSAKYQIAKSPFPQEVQDYKEAELVEIPHDTSCYTQGLSFINSTHILQSCGIYRHSFFHILKYQKEEDGSIVAKEVYKSDIYPSTYFLEGSVVFPKNNYIYILTWRENVVFQIDLATMQEVDKLTWGSQGWGLTHNNTHLIVSDGSDTIYITNQNMEILEKIKAKDHLGQPKKMLNQLEWIQQGEEQFVLANVYGTDQIVKINLRTGEIAETNTFAELVLKEAQMKHLQVMNGIAYNKESKTYLLTGKQWGYMYQMVHL